MFLLDLKNYGIKTESNKKVTVLKYLGLVLLKKGITLLDFIIANEAT